MKLHGGDVYGVSRAMGIEVERCLDFSANINPFGIPAGVRNAMEQALFQAVHYPDPDCRALCEALASYHGGKMEWVLCGNGGADILYRIVLAARPRCALVPAPTFLEYEEALSLTETGIRYYDMGPELEIQPDFLDAVTEEMDMLFLCTPNNPTGHLIGEDLLLSILERAREKKIRVVLDECFLDFVTDGEARSMIRMADRYPNLVIVRSFTKMYGIPGIRLGYGICSDDEFLGRMRRAGQTWPVNGVAQAAGLAALKERAFVEETAGYVRREREWLKEQLRMRGFFVYDGQADYLLFLAKGYPDLYERLLPAGIIIRRCANYRNLTREHYRIAVKRHEENEVLIRHLTALAAKRQTPLMQHGKETEKKDETEGAPVWQQR